MENRGEIPSLPSNYVSILHLRERWLKEKERNQKEKEEEKRPEQQVQQQEVQRRESVEKNGQDQKPEDVEPVVQNHPRFHTASRSENGSGKFQRNHRAVTASNRRNVNETCKKNEAEGEPLLAVPRIETDKKKKKSKRKGHKKKNPRAQNEEMDKTSGTPEENSKEEMRETECELGVQKREKNVRARRVDEKKGIGSRCGPETGNMHEMKEMEHKLSRISVDFEIKRGRNNSVHRGSSQGNRNFRDHQNFRRWAPRRQRDDGMIWVRKDELSKGA